MTNDWYNYGDMVVIMIGVTVAMMIIGGQLVDGQCIGWLMDGCDWYSDYSNAWYRYGNIVV